MDINSETSPSLPESQSLTEIPQQATVVKKNILLTRVVPIILGVLFLFCSTTILYAYGKLPAGNKAFQESVSNTIQGLPFMPKTPQYLLEHITKAHEEKPTGKIQGTLTAYSPIFQFLLGSDEVTADVTGVIDITNPNQPLLSLTATTEQGIAADIVFRDNQIYFRITKLPALLSRVNPALADTLLHAWFTGGTYQMQKNTEGNPITTMLSDYTASDIQQIITFDSSFFNLSPEYHITLLPDNQMLSHLGINRVSSVVFDLWIDKTTYLTTQTALRFTLQFESNNKPLPLGMGEMTFVLDSTITDHGKPVTVIKPENAADFKTILQNLPLQ